MIITIHCKKLNDNPSWPGVYSMWNPSSGCILTRSTLEISARETTRILISCHTGETYCALRWRHNDHSGVSNHQPHGCLPNRLFRRKSKKTSKLRVTGLCAGNSPGTGEFPAQMASYAENVSIWWRHQGKQGKSQLIRTLHGWGRN